MPSGERFRHPLVAVMLLTACGGSKPSPPNAAIPVSEVVVPDAPAERPAGKSPRTEAVLTNELRELESRLAARPRECLLRPTLLRQLAEDYVELTFVAATDQGRADARAKAIADYTQIRDEYPSDPQLDEVLFYLGHEYEEQGDSAKANAVYFDVIKKFPDSKFVPQAYLAYAERFFQEAARDPAKWELATRAYLEVVKFPPPANALFGYAWYKLAFVFTNQKEDAKALAALKKTIDYGEAFSQLPNATKLAETARQDIIPVFARAGDPTKAYNFFKTLSGDAAGENKRTFRMMDALAQEYRRLGQDKQAAALSKELESRKSP